MSSGNADNDVFDLIPELGDLVTIVSELYSSTTGQIIYRSDALIRIRPRNVSDRAVNFPLDPESQMFTDNLGVTEVIIHEKCPTPHYSKQLAVVPGERLEFYSSEGQEVAPIATVEEVIATATEDAIRLSNGQILNFGFIGPEDPIEVIRPRSGEDLPPENNVAEGSEETENAEEERETEEEFFPDIDVSLLPAAMVEEIPTSERTYSDTIQRQDMFVSLLLDVPLSKQKNPRILRNLYRKTDLLMALKNSMVIRDETGGVVVGSQRSYIAGTFKEVLEKQTTGAPIANLLPVAAVKKVLYTDDADAATEMADVEIRPDVFSLLEFSQSDKMFRGDQGFVTYMDFLLRRNLPTFLPATAENPVSISVDQDVLRSQIPDHAAEGFPQHGLDATEELNTSFLGNVGERTARLLSATQFREPKSGLMFQTAPADTASTVAHILLSPELTPFRAPTRSSVLLWDIYASERSRAAAQSFYRFLTRSWEKQQVLDSAAAAELRIADELTARISPVIKFASRSLMGLTDSFGLRNLELTEELMTPILAALETGRKSWDDAMTQLRKRALDSLKDSNNAPLFPTVDSGVSAALWTEAVLKNAEMAEALKHLQDRDPVLAATTFARSAFFSREANMTLSALWYALAGQVSADAAEIAENTYVAERRRLERVQTNQRTAAAAMKAAPTLNACVHVHELESLRGVREDDKRMLLFQRFYEKYKAGTRGNWVECGTCKQDLVCRHEVLLLNEFLHPGRSASLHKALLLEFSGPVFEGAYICKNCGQKIAELEYDTHLEYDDEGRPLVGRTVIAEEGSEDDNGLAVTLEMEGEESDTLGFKGDDLALFYLARTTMEKIGMNPDKAMYERMIGLVRAFIQEKLPNREKWEAQIKQIRALAAAGKKVQEPPPFDRYDANMRVGAMAAAALLELQTSHQVIPFPFQKCKLDRGGVPLEPTGNGALKYVACAVADIRRNDRPWNQTFWTSETSDPKRQTAAENAMQSALAQMLGLPGPTGIPYPPLTVGADVYKDLLQTLRSRSSEEVSAADLPSSADVVPPQFRPLPRSHVTQKESTDAVRSASQLKRNSAEGDFVKTQEYVRDRQTDLIHSLVGKLHSEAETSARGLGVLSAANPRSDSVCCFMSLRDVESRGVGLAEAAEGAQNNFAMEVEVLESAASILHHRDPARSSNGTHLYIPWSAPPQVALQTTPDETMYYRLFMKHCYRGDNLGGVHEYLNDGVCKQCGFQLPEALEFLTPSNISETDGRKFEAALAKLALTRKEICLKAFATQGIVIDESAFLALQDAIHLKKSVPPTMIAEPQTVENVLSDMRDLVAGAPFVPQAQDEWRMFESAMTEILSKGITDENKRKFRLAGFVQRYDTLRAGIENNLKTMLGARPKPADVADISAGLDALQRMTEVLTGGQAVRNIMDIFVTGAQQVARQYQLVKPPVNKWFPKVSRSHKELLTNIWEKRSRHVDMGIRMLETLEPAEVQTMVKDVLEAVAGWLGVWLQYWITNVRPGNELTTEELQYVLRWSLMHVLFVCVGPDSPLMRTANAQTRPKVTNFFRVFFLQSLKFAAGDVENYQLTSKQIQDALHIRAEKEKAYFIKRFDDIEDRDLRKLELMKKKLKIGDWAVGNTKNLFSYDQDFYEFERAQRAAMGIPEFTGDITGDQGAQGAQGAQDRFGFYDFGTETVGVSDANDHRVSHDEDM